MRYNERIREIREENFLTQQKIADLLNVGQRTYADYESGKTRIPVDSLLVLARFYNVSLECITCLNPIPPKCEYLAFVSFNNCSLYVPAGSEDAYRNAPIWEKFSSINPISSVDRIEYDTNDSPIEYYNLQGGKVDNPHNGVFIKIQDEKATKVIVK